MHGAPPAQQGQFEAEGPSEMAKLFSADFGTLSIMYGADVCLLGRKGADVLRQVGFVLPQRLGNSQKCP